MHTPFKDWDLAFITSLWCNNPTVHVTLLERTPLPPAELARFNYILNFDASGKLQQVKPKEQGK